jgi:hypothetical protein
LEFIGLSFKGVSVYNISSSFLGFCSAIMTLPAVLMTRNDDFEYSVDDVMNSVDFRKEMFKGDRFLKALKPILLKLNGNGVLDD